LAQGEYVSPEQLENIFLESKFIGQIFVHGDSLRDCLVAIVIPNEQIAAEWALASGISKTKTELYESNELQRKIISELQTLCISSRRPKYEIPKRIFIDSVPFTAGFTVFVPFEIITENGKLTPSMKPCRFKIASFYQKQIKDMYDDIENSTSLSLASYSATVASKNTQEKLKGIMSQVLHTDNVENGDFFEMGGDSLAAVRYLALPFVSNFPGS
jgi:hypothetical protein